MATIVRLPNNFFYEIHKDILNDRNTQKAAIDLVNKAFLPAKLKAIREFENHDVSREIKEGPKGDKSKFLIGPSDGNLFSFIGFDEGTDPVQKVIDYLQQSISISKRPTLNYKQSAYKFRVRYPTVDDFQTDEAAPMPRNTSKNWLYAIERGIPGINYYLFKRGQHIARSHSGPAIQAKNRSTGDLQRVRTGARFRNTSYLTKIINEFVSELK